MRIWKKTMIVGIVGMFVISLVFPPSLFAEPAENSGLDNAANNLGSLHRQSSALALALYIHNDSAGTGFDGIRQQLLEKFAEVKAHIEMSHGRFGSDSKIPADVLAKIQAAGHGGVDDAGMDDMLHPGWAKLPDLPDQASERAHEVLAGLKEGNRPGRGNIEGELFGNLPQEALQNRLSRAIGLQRAARGRAFGMAQAAAHQPNPPQPPAPPGGEGGGQGGGQGKGKN